MVITAAPSWRLLPASALNTLTSLALAVTSVLHTVTSLTTSDLIRVFTEPQYVRSDPGCVAGLETWGQWTEVVTGPYGGEVENISPL